MDIGVEVSFPKEVYDKLNCIPVVSAVLSHFIIDKNLSEYRYMIISGIARLLDFLLMPQLIMAKGCYLEERESHRWQRQTCIH